MGNELVKLIQQVIDRDRQEQCMTGKVISVDKGNCTIVINTSGDDDTDPEPDITEVMLRSVTDGSSAGVVVFPAVGSFVTVSILFNNRGVLYVSQYSEVEEILVTISSFKYRLNKDGMVFNDGTNGGLIIISKLQAEIAKLNGFVNAIRTAFASWVPVPGDGGAVLKGIMSAALPGQQTADLSSITNDKIKH
jgi:hypothetical protein